MLGYWTDANQSGHQYEQQQKHHSTKQKNAQYKRKKNRRILENTIKKYKIVGILNRYLTLRNKNIKYTTSKYIMFEKNANSPAGDQVLSELQTTVLHASALYLHGIGNLTMEEAVNCSNYITIMYANLEALKLATK